MPLLSRLVLAASLLAAPGALAENAIVGAWSGEVTQGENKFQTQLTFVSPTGGISRYPSIPCGGILSGDRKGDEYVFDETVTWGGLEEKADGCIPGLVRVTVDGDKMKYEWTGTYNGENFSAAGELRRVKRRR